MRSEEEYLDGLCVFFGAAIGIIIISLIGAVQDYNHLTKPNCQWEEPSTIRRN